MTNNQLSKPKILIVEDDVFLAGLLSEHFKKAGLDFDLAVDGEGALSKARAEQFDLILLDLILPGIDGYEVLEQMKKDTALAQIPVLIFSNLGQKEEIERGLRLGAIDFLVKAKFDLNEIVAKIKQILQGSNQS